MGAAGLAAVVAPPLVGPRVGLIASTENLARTQPASYKGWTTGIAYLPEDACGALPVPAPVGCGDVSPGDLDIGVESGVVEWEPYVLHDGVTCTARSKGALDWEAVARRRLARSESAQLEAELWDGARTRATSLGNGYLADATAVDLTMGVSAAATDALGLLQQYLAEIQHGRRGMIHATRTAITAWSSLNLLRREGAVIFDMFDNIVVPGAGYSGSGPAAVEGGAPTPAADGSVWAYATGPIDLFLDTVELDGVSSATVDRTVNDIEIRAQRIGLASWDRCALGAVEMDLPVVVVGS